MSGYEKSPDYGSNSPPWVTWAAVAVIVLLGWGLALLTAPRAAGEPQKVERAEADSGPSDTGAMLALAVTT